MIWKFCGSQYNGCRCPSCGKVIPLMKRSSDLDILMRDSPLPDRALSGGEKPEKAESIKPGYDDHAARQQDQVVDIAGLSPRSGQKINMLIVYGAVLLAAVLISGFLNRYIGYRRGFHEGKALGIEQGIEEGNETASKTYSQRLEELNGQHLTEVRKARQEGYREGYQKAQDEEFPAIMRINLPYSAERNQDAVNLVVKKIQTKLLSLRYEEVGEADGIYAENTERAVKQFQEDRQLPVTGAVDKQTYRCLFPKEVLSEDESTAGSLLFTVLTKQSG